MTETWIYLNKVVRGIALYNDILDTCCNDLDGKTVVAALGSCVVDVIVGSVPPEDREAVVDCFCDFLKERVKARTESETKTNGKK